MRKMWIASFALLFTVGCGSQQDTTTDDFSDLAGLDTKSDLFSKKMKIAGDIPNDTSIDVDYSKTPLYRALTVDGLPGMAINVSITAWDGSVATAWLLDSKFKIVYRGTVVDTGGDFLSNEMQTTLTAEDTYYLVFREENKRDTTFTVFMDAKGGVDYYACKVDSDCVATPRNECCGTGWNEAVNKKEVAAYHASFMCPEAHPICPLYIIDDTRVPKCQANKCTMVAKN